MELVSLVITMSSEFSQQAGIDATHQNVIRPRSLEPQGSLVEPPPIGTAHEQFNSPLRHISDRVFPVQKRFLAVYLGGCLRLIRRC